MIKGKTKKNVYFFICDVLSIINKLIPKSKNKILFFSSNDITDNSKSVLDYLIDNKYNDKYKITCCVRDVERYSDVSIKNLSYKKSIMGIYEILTSKYIFFHGEIIAIKPSKSQMSIDLWHGTPLKKFNKLADKLKDYRYNFFSYLLASSEAFKPIMRACFDCNMEQMVVLGHPRNDELFKGLDALNKVGIDKNKYKKVFLWMPTFRVSKDNFIVDIKDEFKSETGISIFNTNEKLMNLNNLLKEKESFMIIKLHPAQNLNCVNTSNYENIKFLMNEDIEKHGIHLYNLVGECDSLITDYSSIFFDYLLLNRPIGFTIEDIESYEDTRGFVFENPLDYMPGMKIKDVEGFNAFLEDVIQGKDGYEDERKRINDFANKYQDNLNCKRLVEFSGL